MSTIITTGISNSSSSILTNQPMLADAFGRLRTSDPMTLFDSSHRYRDNGLWNTSTTSGGTLGAYVSIDWEEVSR